MVETPRRPRSWWVFTTNRNFIVDILACVYGFSSWLAITGVWMELPLLVQFLPEGWSLGASLTFAIQAANVGPVIFGIGRKLWPNVFGLTAANHFQLTIGTAGCVILIFFWWKTVPIFGHQVSIMLYISSFALSVVDCTSSVVYLPFMGKFKGMYMTSFLIGEGVGGLLSSVFAIAQGIEEVTCVNVTQTIETDTGNVTVFVPVPEVSIPRFSAEVFFTLLLILMVSSWIAFCLLCYWKLALKEQIQENRQLPQELELALAKQTEGRVEVEFRSFGRKCKPTAVSAEKAYYYYLLAVQTWCSLLSFGILPAIQSYSCLPYGDKAFHLSVTLCGVAYPLACFLGMFVVFDSRGHISAMTATGSAISIYLFVTAFMSPHPPMHGTQAGSQLIVTCWTVTYLLLSYAKTVVCVVLTKHGEEALFWAGAVTQIGSFFGSLVMYFVVTFANVFHENSDCPSLG